MSGELDATRLRRSIPLPLLVAYGVGTMVGAGFYALLGEVASHAGMFTPFAFLLAAGIAFISAMSFSELSSRFPFSAGEARYVHEAFHRKWLAILVGWSVISTGVVSAATLTRAFVGFLQDLINIPTALGIVLFLIALTLIASRGILESMWFTALITLIEVGGLFFVMLANCRFLADLPERWNELTPDVSWGAWSGIMLAAFVAFYAFIGFEDMVNEAEEVREPRKNLPRGIMFALAITSTLYFLTALTAVLAFPPQELAESRTPLALLVSRHGELARVGMIYISLLAGVNGSLVQVIMASRIAYGLSIRGLGPRSLAVVHVRYRTPIRATLLMSGLIMGFALWLPLELLARTTSSIMLFNFAIVNASLAKIKLNQRLVSDEIITYPIAIPVLGCIMCLIFLGLQFFATTT